MTASLPANRIVFLDKIRYSLVIGVVVLHAACAYALIIHWWSVRDPVQSPVLDLLILVLDIFSMPVLFFVSGFFALSSLARQGPSRFIISKLERLGIPLLLIGLFFVPLISFIGYRNSTPDAHGFFRFWWMHNETGWHAMRLGPVGALREPSGKEGRDDRRSHPWLELCPCPTRLGREVGI